MEEYLALVKRLPKPTRQQTAAFISRLAREHSWYKHLSGERDTPFVFFFDPNAGKTLIRRGEEGFFRRTRYAMFKEKGPLEQIPASGYWRYGIVGSNGLFVVVDVVNGKGREEDLPADIVKDGTFMMSRYLHYGFGKCVDKRGEHKTGAQLHIEIIMDLQRHLNLLTELMYN